MAPSAATAGGGCAVAGIGSADPAQAQPTFRAVVGPFRTTGATGPHMHPGRVQPIHHQSDRCRWSEMNVAAQSTPSIFDALESDRFVVGRLGPPRLLHCLRIPAAPANREVLGATGCGISAE